METDIYFFSPTGTCRGAAELLHNLVPGGRLVDLTLPAQRAAAPSPDGERLFTLVFPVYAERIPDLVRDWLRTLPKSGGMACLVACYGSVTVGNVLADTAKLVTDTLGMTIIAGAELPGPHSFDCAETKRNLHAVQGWTENELANFFHAALQKAERGGGAACFPCSPAVGAILPQDFLCKLGSPYPAIDREKCTHCGACERACPSGAATGRHFLCVRCTACVRACPHGARSHRFRTGVPGLFLEHNMAEKKTARYIL